MKFSIKDFFSKCERTPEQLQICSYLLKKSLLDFFSKYEQICYLVKLTDQINQAIFDFLLSPGLFKIQNKEYGIV